MITNRRLIDKIRGRAAAGDSNPLLPLAAQPPIVRSLQRAIVAVGATGLSAALLVGLGDDVMTLAARAAVSGGGAHGSGGSSGEDAPVSELAATDAVEAVAGDVQHVTRAVTGVEAPVDLAGTVELLTEPVSFVAPAPEQVAAPAPAPTVPTTVPAPPPAPAPGSVEAIITEVFGAHARAAIGVARCESGLNPGAVSRGGGNWGLFQINRVHRGRVEAMGYRWEDILDARVNTVVAYSIFQEQGWGPWGCRRAAG